MFFLRVFSAAEAMSEACWAYALTRSAVLLTLSRSSSLRLSFFVGLGSATPRSRLSGFLERLMLTRSLMTAPAATPANAMPPAINGVFAFEAASEMT